jgi:hypothetical protein
MTEICDNKNTNARNVNDVSAIVKMCEKMIQEAVSRTNDLRAAESERIDQMFKSHKEYFDSKFIAQKELNESILKERDERLAQKFESLAIAITKAENATEKRFECVETSTPILCADLIWRPAGELQVNDPIIALDEDVPDRRGRRFRLAYVTENSIAEDELYEVKTSRGIIKCNGQHLWLSRENQRAWAGWKWIKTTDLTTGHEVNCPLDVWEVSNSYEAGWLAGMFDGEGCLSKGKGRVQLSITQRESLTSERIEKTLRQWTDRICCHRSSFEGKKKQKQVIYHFIISNRPEILKIIGSVRPPRLLETAEKAWNGMVMASHERITTIVSVKPIGVGKIARLSTSTHTYIAEGFAMHNSVNEFRATLADQQKTFLTAAEYKSAHQNLVELVNNSTKTISDTILTQKERIDKIENMKTGGQSTWMMIVGIVAFLSALFSIALHFIK